MSVFAFNLLQIVKRADAAGENMFVTVDSFEKIYFSSNRFVSMFSSDVCTVIDDVSHNENQALYDAKKAETVEEALTYFTEVQPYVINEYEYDSAQHYDSGEDEDYSSDENGEGVTAVYGTVENSDSIIKAGSSYPIYSTSNDSNERKFSFSYAFKDSYLNCGTITVWFETDIYADAEQAKADFQKQFGDYVYHYYCGTTAEAGESAKLVLDKVKFYAEYPDGSTAGNVENPQEFIASVRQGNYYVLENGQWETGGNLPGDIDYRYYHSYANDTADKAKVYFSLNDAYSGNDGYGDLAKQLEAGIAVDPVKAITLCIISLAGAIAAAVFSVRLAGHKDGEIQTALIDKMPFDLHLIFSALAVFGMGAAMLFTLVERLQSEALESADFFPAFFAESDFMLALICAEACVIYLIILEFASSFARNIKAKENIFKRTMLYGMWRIAVSCARRIKRLFVKIGRFFETLFFAPKKLGKGTLAAVALYTGINFIVVVIGMSLVFSYQELLGAVLMLLLLAGDVFLIYKVFRYMRSLDKIISCAEQNIPVEINEKELSPSLKSLADALDRKTAELQSAIIKAVKDERTKAELITNVSHDLKTPLTSVINYIDLLKKCDIEDETARKYMEVIDEKSIKLKRLIEDLIEASKVSAGNITINRTKINLNELAAQAIVEETADIEKRGLHIIFEEPADKHIVFADGTKLYRVFENLLSNARKYSAPDSRIYARVYSDNDSGYFEIKNMSKEPLNISAEELTERFVRGDKSRSEDGNGLGLSIAKQLCILNGGELIIAIDGDLFKATVRMPKNSDGEEQSK